MSLQERTLVVKNFDFEKTTPRILKELCLQGGPVRNVVIRPDHAFVEYEDVDSVGYSKALLDGVQLFGKKLILESKLRNKSYFRYTKILHDYVEFDKKQQQQLQQQTLQSQQQMMAIYNQQVQLGPQYPFQLNPNLQPPINYYPTINPYVAPNNFSAPQDQFIHPDPAPSSVSSHNNDQMRRSRSFNQRQQRPHERSRSARNSDHRRR